MERSSPILAHWRAGELQFGELVRLYNEHRIFFPLLLILQVGELTHYNGRALMFAGWFMQCLSALVLWLLVARGEESLRSALWKFVPVSFLIFSLRQYENWLWANQVVIFMQVLFFLLAVYLLETGWRGGARFYLALLCGVISSFSFGNGLLVWPIGLAQLAGQRYFRGPRGGPGAAAAGGALGRGRRRGLPALFPQLPEAGSPPEPGLLPPAPGDRGEVLCRLPWQPAGGRGAGGLRGGRVVLALGLYVAALALRDRRPVRAPALFAIMPMTVLTGALLVVSRAGFGVRQALESRYLTFGALGISALYLLILSLAPGARRSALAGFALGVIAPAVVASVAVGVDDGRRWRAQRLAGAHYLRTHRQQTDAHLETLFINSEACPVDDPLFGGGAFQRLP